MSAHVSHAPQNHSDTCMEDAQDEQCHDFVLDPRDVMSERPQPLGGTKKIIISDITLIVGANLKGAQLKNLTDLLARNLDLFAWTIRDVLGIDPTFICHRLSLDKGVKSIDQAR